MSERSSKRRKVGAEESALDWLLDRPKSEFLEQVWGQKPVVMKTKAENLFGVETLKKVTDQNELIYGLHMNVVNCPAGNKVVVHEEGKRATRKEISKFMQTGKGCTIQFFQPQRHVDELWKRMEALEREFSSLWGANVYLTAAGTQGLAPHFDDVDVFVVQTEGRKRWKLHKPSDPSHELALEYSEDLENVGDLLLEVVLEPGDVLYMPRGTTHYAMAEGEEPSVHITLSTHQNHTYYNLMDVAMTKILDAAASKNSQFRRGLPVGYLWENGMWRTSKRQPTELTKNVAGLLRQMADELETSRVEQDESVAQALQEAVDQFAVDFMKNRLPPFQQDHLPKPPSEKAINQMSGDSKVRLVDPTLLHVSLLDSSEEDEKDDIINSIQQAMQMECASDCDEEDCEGEKQSNKKQHKANQEKEQDEDEDESDNEEADDEDEEPMLAVFQSRWNSRELHMFPRNEEQEEEWEKHAVFLEYASMPVLAKLLQQFPESIRVKDLVDEEKGLSEEVVLGWCKSLTTSCVLESVKK